LARYWQRYECLTEKTNTMNLFERYENLKSRARAYMTNGNIEAYMDVLLRLNRIKKEIQTLSSAN